MTWPLPDRVKRLSLPSYKYNELDLKYLEILVVENDDGMILGVVAWQQAENDIAPKHKTALLLHGLYVDPAQHRRGVGSKLFHASENAAKAMGLDGLLAKVKLGSELFYQVHVMQKLAVENADREFLNRYWKAVK